MPVDIATGSVRLVYEDLVVEGKVDLTWERLYSTKQLERPATALGPGWTCRYFATLARVAEGYQFVTPEGDPELFPDTDGTIERGGVVRRLGTFEELFHRDATYVVQRWDVDTGEITRWCFVANASEQPWR